MVGNVQMSQRLFEARHRVRGARPARPWFALGAISLIFLTASATDAFAQGRFHKKYPARQNVRLQLMNRSGTITVEAWDRNEIKISADLESPAARFTPELSDEGLIIDVERDNRGRDVGDVNFRIHVPVNATVDLVTKRGQIIVRGVRGALVRAKVISEGDIELTGLRAATVMASNIMGDILFDADLLQGGVYELTSMQGNINIRITAGSGFRLSATAPMTRNIDLGAFANSGVFDYLGGKPSRRVVGQVGAGGASLTTISHRGSIAF